MHRLEDTEYVLIHRGKRGQSYEYELLYQGEGQNNETFMMGLIDVKKLHNDAKKEPLNQKKKPSSSPQSAPKLPPSSTGKNTEKTTNTALNNINLKNPQESTSYKNNGASHHNNIMDVYT